MTKTNQSTLIDAFGELKAAQAELEAKEAEFKAAFAEFEPGSYEGERYRLTISVQEREQQDAAFKARVQALIEVHISRQFMQAHTTVRPVRTHRVAARTGKGLAAEG